MLLLSAIRTVVNYIVIECSIFLSYSFFKRLILITSMYLYVNGAFAGFGYDNGESNWCGYALTTGRLDAINSDWIVFKNTTCPT